MGVGVDRVGVGAGRVEVGAGRVAVGAAVVGSGVSAKGDNVLVATGGGGTASAGIGVAVAGIASTTDAEGGTAGLVSSEIPSAKPARVTIAAMINDQRPPRRGWCWCIGVPVVATGCDAP